MAETEKKEQVQPLAPAAIPVDIPERDDFSIQFTPRRRQKCIKFCGCATAIVLILVTVVLVLMLTVFHIKDPILIMNSTKLQGVDVLVTNTTRHFGPGLNMTFEADVSIKNPNVASFKFNQTTTTLYYDGSDIGEVRTPEGRVEARRTIRMNVTVDVMVDRVVEVPRFRADFGARILPITSYTSISGQVKITEIVKKHFVVVMNCTMNLNLSSRELQDRNCRRRVLL